MPDTVYLSFPSTPTGEIKASCIQTKDYQIQYINEDNAHFGIIIDILLACLIISVTMFVTKWFL